MSQIEITPDLLAELKRKAEACEPKVYEIDDDGGNAYPNIVVRLDNGEVQIISSVDFLPDGEHMAAADPATVLALVAEIERLQAMERRWHKLLANAQPGPECIGQGFEVKAINKESEAAGE